MIIKRDYYLEKLISARSLQMIKIITGIRRCGKTYLLFNLFVEYLKNDGVDDNHIIKIGLEDRRNMTLRDPDNLLRYVDGQIKDDKEYFILIDEVQMLESFVDVLNSFLHMDNVNVYVTGSNSKFLSKDVVTEFRGRGWEIALHPVSFEEYYQALGADDRYARLEEYFKYGGIPSCVILGSEADKRQYLESLFQTTYINDIVERNKIKNTSELNELMCVIASSVGSLCNPNKIANTFQSVKKVKIDYKTIDRYLEYMEDAFLIQKAKRFDLKGKRYINTLSKYYYTDVGLRNALVGFKETDKSHIMENIIYNELINRGYEVSVGTLELKTTNKAGETVRKQLEVDFVVETHKTRYYIQSAYRIYGEEKMEQEIASLRQINDSFKKVVIVDNGVISGYDEHGIFYISLFDFLMNKNSLE